MGRCGQQKAPLYENDVNDLEEAVANGEENLVHGLDLLEQIVALLPEGIDVFINFEEVDDADQEGIFMSLPAQEEYPEEVYYPEDNDTWRQVQLKSGLVDEHYDENYDWSCEGDQEEYEEYSTDGLTSLGQSDHLFRRLSALPFSSGLYYDDPLAQEEIAIEILELEHLVDSEFLGSSLDTDHLGMHEEDFKEYCNDCMNEKK